MEFRSMIRLTVTTNATTGHREWAEQIPVHQQVGFVFHGTVCVKGLRSMAQSYAG